jgi:hypothetical protein
MKFLLSRIRVDARRFRNASPVTPSSAAPSARSRARAPRPRRVADVAGDGDEDSHEPPTDVTSLPSPDREELADAFADLLGGLIEEGRLSLASDIRRTEVVSSGHGFDHTKDRASNDGS